MVFQFIRKLFYVFFKVLFIQAICNNNMNCHIVIHEHAHTQIIHDIVLILLGEMGNSGSLFLCLNGHR